MKPAVVRSFLGALYAGVALGIGSSALAAIEVDGRFDPGEGYELVFDLEFAVEGNTPPESVPGGKLYWKQDGVSQDLFFLFSQPLELVDNSYGDTRVGWGTQIHEFQDGGPSKSLEGSDKAEFIFKDSDGNEVLDVVIDYIKDFGAGVEPGQLRYRSDVTKGASGVVAAATSLEYNYANFKNETDDQGDGSPLFGADADSPATNDPSGFDCNTTSPTECYDVKDSDLTGWLFNVNYEVQIAGNTFNNEMITGSALTLGIVHDSPNKIAKNKVQFVCGSVDGFSKNNLSSLDEIRCDSMLNGGNGTVPEPGTLALFGMGLAGIFVRRRRARS